MAFRLPLIINFTKLSQVCSSKLCASRVATKLADPVVCHRSFNCIADCHHTRRLQLTNTTTLLTTSKRFKKKNSKVTADDQDGSDSDGDDSVNENPLLDDEEGEEDGRELLTIQVSSTRLDSVAKTAFAISRAKIEEQFYKGELLVNGQRPYKKSEEIHVGDEIDLFKFVDSDDRSKTHVRRVTILHVPDLISDSKMKIKIAKWQDLVIDTRDTQ